MTDTPSAADALKFKKIPMKPHEFYVECPCCLDDHIIERVEDHADIYTPDDMCRFIKCECGQNIEAIAVEVVAPRAAAPQEVDVEKLYQEICMTVKYTRPATPDCVDGAGIGIKYALHYLAQRNLIGKQG